MSNTMITVERDLLLKALEVLAYDTDDRYGKKADLRSSLREALTKQNNPATEAEGDTELLDECYKSMTAAMSLLESNAGHGPVLDLLMQSRAKIERRRHALKVQISNNTPQP